MNRHHLLRLLTLGATAVSAGCITVGPDYEPLAPGAPPGWAQAQGPTDSGTFSEPPDLWWHNFDDPQLVQLVERSRVENLDVQAAGSRIAQARASLGISQGDLLPFVSAYGSGNRSQSSEEVGTGRQVDFYGVGLDAGWELDLFGGTRRSIEASVADLEGRMADRQAALVSVSAEAALRYVEIRALQRRLEIADENLAAQQETSELTQFRAQAGLSTELDVQLARSNLESTRARVPDLENQLAMLEDRMADDLKQLRVEMKAMHKELSAALAKADRERGKEAEKLSNDKVARRDLADLLKGLAQNIYPESTKRSK